MSLRPIFTAIIAILNVEINSNIKAEIKAMTSKTFKVA